MADEAPKTAYELAMARLRQKERDAGQEEKALTDAQKTEIAEARSVHRARVAEREILHRDALTRARDHEEIERLGEELRRDLDRLASDRDRKIDEIRRRE
jgi:hypothetical protein